MINHLHLLGGQGKIGQSLYKSLIKNPIGELNYIWVYCDGNKVLHENQILEKSNYTKTVLRIIHHLILKDLIKKTYSKGSKI